MRQFPVTSGLVKLAPASSLRTALLVLALVLTVPEAGADDAVRRAQEELRKRNLYFGDIDGATNRGTTGALRRYQERKGLDVTGEADRETLRSLGIAPSHPGNSAASFLQPDPWPEVPVLRSDKARRTATSPGETSGGKAEAARQPEDEVQERGDQDWAPGPVEPAPSASPQAPDNHDLPTLSAARAFVEGYLLAGSDNNVRKEMSYYAKEVDYFDKGLSDHGYIRRDVTNYDKRWPERHFEIVGPVTVTPGGRPGEVAVGFQVHFVCRSQTRAAEGRTDNLITLRSNLQGGWQIIGLKEQRRR